MMYRRKVTVTAGAVFAIGVAFAAQPTSDVPEGRPEELRQRAPWEPGADMLMSAHEVGAAPLAPPR